MRKQWRGCKKSMTLVTLWFRSVDVSLENCRVTLLALKLNFARTPMLRTLLLIFVMPFMG